MQASDLIPEQRLCVALILEAIREANRGCDKDRQWLLTSRDKGLHSFRWCLESLGVEVEHARAAVIKTLGRKSIKNTQSIARLLRGVS